MSDSGGTLPKFGDWDVNDPTSAEGYTMIFNKARDEKKTGSKPESPVKVDPGLKHRIEAGKPQAAASLILLFPQGEKMVLLRVKPTSRILTSVSL